MIFDFTNNTFADQCYSPENLVLGHLKSSHLGNTLSDITCTFSIMVVMFGTCLSQFRGIGNQDPLVSSKKYKTFCISFCIVWENRNGKKDGTKCYTLSVSYCSLTCYTDKPLSMFLVQNQCIHIYCSNPQQL